MGEDPLFPGEAIGSDVGSPGKGWARAAPSSPSLLTIISTSCFRAWMTLMGWVR
jgi:hypothetical protein